MQDSANSRKEELVMKLVKSIALLGILIIGMSGGVQAATYTLDINFITNDPNVFDYGDLAAESQINSLIFDIGDPYTVDFTGTIIPGGWDTTTYLTGVAGLGQGVLNPDFNNPNPIVSSGRIFAITSDSAPTNLLFTDFLAGFDFQDADGDGVYDTAWGFFPDPTDPNIILEGTIPGQYFTVQVVPVPAAVWLLGSGVVGLVVLKRRKSS
jgi:hypothetical protein